MNRRGRGNSTEALAQKHMYGGEDGLSGSGTGLCSSLALEGCGGQPAFLLSIFLIRPPVSGVNRAGVPERLLQQQGGCQPATPVLQCQPGGHQGWCSADNRR